MSFRHSFKIHLADKLLVQLLMLIFHFFFLSFSSFFFQNIYLLKIRIYALSYTKSFNIDIYGEVAHVVINKPKYFQLALVKFT